MYVDNLLFFRRYIFVYSEKWIYNEWGNLFYFSFILVLIEIYGKCKMVYMDILEFFLIFVIIIFKRI